MKKIKRSISILLIAMMALAMLGGCGNNSTSGNSTANGDSAKATEKTADAGEAKGTESNPFILGVSPMSGWYAWYGVKDTGIFEQNGVYVDLQFFPVYSDSLTAFYSGQVDGICIAASDAVQKIVDSWFDGVEKLNARDDDFIQAICDGAELTRDDYMTMLDGVTIFDKAKNEETFKDGDDYTYLSYTLQKSAEFLLSTKMINEIPDDLSSILDDTYIKGAE